MRSNPSQLRQILSGDPAADPEEESGLPSFEDGKYQAHARPANKPVFAIHFLETGGKGRTFQYGDLRSRGDKDACDFDNGQFKLTFLGVRAVEVTVEGRNLWRLYDLINQHRMAWVMQAAEDFAEDGETIINRVGFAEAKES